MDFKTSDMIIRNMPKVEIHLHLEGAFTFEFLFDLICKYGGEPGLKNIEDLRKKFIFKDFPHFIQTWFWKNKFFRAPEDFEESTYRTLKNLSQQNVIYAEVFFSPWDFIVNGLNVEEIIEATISGIRKAENDCKIKCGLIADIVRDHGADNSIQRLNQITPFLNNGIIGIGLGGNEKDFPPAPFAEVFLEAKRRGFHTTAHAGEAAGANSVWSALLDLQVERVGHGVRSVEDPKLLDYLKEKQIPLEVCITSNLRTKVYSSLEEHPFDSIYQSGLMVTVNSDDPPMFGANITDEFILLYNKLNYSLENICKINKNAVDASFLNETDKNNIKVIIDNYMPHK